MIELENVAAGVRLLRMARGAVSALDTEFLVALRAAVAETSAAGQALVLTGSGKAFSAGVDLRAYLDGGAAYVEPFWAALSGLFDDLLRYPRPVVAAVNGHAIAGGCVIACCADYRLMSGGTIGVPEMLVGIPFPSTAHASVAIAVGPGAAYLINTGATLRPEEALARGLVDEVATAEDLVERAVARAVALAAVPAATFAHTKAALRRSVLDSLATPVSLAADAAAKEIWASATGQEAVAAYVAATIPRKN
ncbi:MAG: enoyl-CoA hydratase/isomerase family protein [Sporichthyaceae bacterium]